MMRATAPVSFFHFDSSATSCFLSMLPLGPVGPESTFDYYHQRLFLGASYNF